MRKSTPMDAYIRAVAFLSRVAGVAAAFLIGLAVVMICAMVFERFFFIAATFVGSAYVLMTKGHVNVEILPLYLGPNARYWLALFTIVLSLSFCLVLWILCTQYWLEAWSEGWHSNTVWRARLWIPYLAMPVGLGLLVMQYIADLMCLVTGRAPPFGLKPKEDAEEFARAQATQALGDVP